MEVVMQKMTSYRDSPDSTVFVPPGNRTIAKTVLIGDWYSTKIAIYDFWIFKVPFFSMIYLLNISKFGLILNHKITQPLFNQILMQNA